MRDQIKDAFDSIEASAQLKEQTYDYLVSRKRKHVKFNFRKPILVLCSFILFVFVAFGWNVYQTPVAAISIDINPSIELEVNCFDRVIAVEGFNEESKAIVEQINLDHLPYDEAVNKLLENEALKSYLSNDGFVSITVACDKQAKGEAMQQRLQRGTSECQFEVLCMSGNTEDVQKAHEAGLSFGKYQAFEQLQALDPTITIEDVQDKTMREIRDWILALSDGEMSEQSAGNGSRPQDGAGHQHGKN